MSSRDRYAQRTEESANSKRSVGESHARHERTQLPEHMDRLQDEEQSPHSKKLTELRRLGAVDFYGTTDPAEAGTWLKRTARVLGRMSCTSSEQLDLVESLLQGEAYDW